MGREAIRRATATGPMKEVPAAAVGSMAVTQVVVILAAAAGLTVVVISVAEEISRWFDTTKNRGRVGLAGRPSLRRSSLQFLKLVTSGASKNGMPPLPF